MPLSVMSEVPWNSKGVFYSAVSPFGKKMPFERLSSIISFTFNTPQGRSRLQVHH